MKVLNRGLAILLAGVLIFGSGAAFAVSPNANSKAMMNPGRMKAMEKIGEIFIEPKEDIVAGVDVSITPMDNWNVGVIEGWIDLKAGNEFVDFRGNSKIKLKLNNVTVNIDEEGYFSQPMPLWKAQILKVQVFVGKTLDYTMTLEDYELVDEEFDLEDELRFARRVFSRLDGKLDEEDLELEDIGLLKRARTVYTILEEEIGSDDEYDELLAGYLSILRDAEDEIQELLEDMIMWINEDQPELVNDSYEGKLLVDEDLMDDMDEILVIVEFVDSDLDNLEIEIDEDGEFSFDTDEEDFEVRVEIGGLVIPSLGVVFEADPE